MARRRTRKASSPRQHLPGTILTTGAALTAYAQQVSQARVEGSVPLERDPNLALVPFSPNQPLAPQPVNLPVNDGQADPRRFETPVGWNLPGYDQRLVPWAVLRAVADSGVLRRCVQVRKDELTSLEWDVVVADEAIQKARRDDPTADEAALNQTLRSKLASPMDSLRAFWETPDRTNGYDWPTWLSMMLEEHLVLDALALYPRRTFGGDLHALEVIDGSTIKPLLDERGNRPAPPNPAYQQILWGFPRSEFTAVTDPDGEYGVHDLIYAIRNPRTFTPFGFSPVEQSLLDADLYLRRVGWLRAEYTDGAMPKSWIEADTPLTPEQLRGYRTVLNDDLSGSVTARMRLALLPTGFKPYQMAEAAERYKPDYDLHLLRMVAMHFGVLPSKLGFAPTSGLGGAGHQAGEDDTEWRAGILPLVRWVEQLMRAISRRYLDAPPEIAFRFLGLDEEDEAAADAVIANRVSGGRMTLNEGRDIMGRPRYAFPEADMPALISPRGVVFLEGSSEPPPPQIQPVMAVPGGEPGNDPNAPTDVGGNPPPNQPGDAGQASQKSSGTSDHSSNTGEDRGPGAGQASAREAPPPAHPSPHVSPAPAAHAPAHAPASGYAPPAAAEIEAFARWAGKRTKASRAFTWQATPEAARAELDALAAMDGPTAALRARELLKVTRPRAAAGRVSDDARPAHPGMDSPYRAGFDWLVARATRRQPVG